MAHRLDAWLLLLIVGISMLAATPCQAEDSFLLGNDLFQVRVVPGDGGLSKKFGPRFDTTARIDSIKSDGVEFVAQEGLVDEFNQRWVPPPGYDDVPSPGNVFMKIGVGMLRRTRITPYRFWDSYPLVQPAATRNISRDDMRATFEQVMPSSGDLGYRYRKSYEVDPDRRAVEITYELTNLGCKGIEFDQYNHNWLALDAASPSNPWIIRTPLAAGPGCLLHCRISPGELAFDKVPPGVTYFTRAQSGSPPKSFTTVSDGKKFLSIVCDFSASRFAVFTQDNLLAPEIFAQFDVPPGGTVTWHRSYLFKVPLLDPSRFTEMQSPAHMR
ncbi:MAG: hypothetical protein ACOYM3_32145 [Terrimicrobiaceae bacterium]